MRKMILRILTGMLGIFVFTAGFAVPVCAASPLGGIHIFKTDILGAGLEKAAFQIARTATREELEDSSVPKRLLKVGDENITVVYVSFQNSDGELCTEILTDSMGSAFLGGLPYGTYYLVESRAPEGYKRMLSPVRISIHKYSHLTESDGVCDDAGKVIDNTVQIITVRYSLPETGGSERSYFAVATVCLLISAAALLLVNKIRSGYL